MGNCGKELLNAFSEHYECYDFYWALNQKSESKANTKSGGHPLQLCVKLTALQESEFEHVNEYRSEVGSPAVKLDPELLALANYRAWADHTGNYWAHDWMNAHTDEIDGFIYALKGRTWGENTVHGRRLRGPDIDVGGHYLNYYHSTDHYNAMVNKKYSYFSPSNVYVWLPDGEEIYMYCQYDIYMDNVSTYMNP